MARPGHKDLEELAKEVEKEEMKDTSAFQTARFVGPNGCSVALIASNRQRRPFQVDEMLLQWRCERRSCPVLTEARQVKYDLFPSKQYVFYLAKKSHDLISEAPAWLHRRMQMEQGGSITGPDFKYSREWDMTL